MPRKAKKAKKRITAGDIQRLLAERHSKEVVVSECKTGSSWSTTGSGRMDTWVMYKSWAHPKVIAYEIKVSRQDFLTDSKWPGYLDYCNELYFVAPPGIIDISEVPENVGLLVTSANATRLYTKKKAKYRDVQVPEGLYRYLLMNRVKIRSSSYYVQDPDGDNTKYWTQWLQEKAEKKELGHKVSRALATIVREKIENVEMLMERVQAENKHLQHIKDELEKAELWPITEWRFENKLNEMVKQAETGLPDGFIDELDVTIRHLNKLRTTIKENRKG